jgi:nicotinate-nucleotide pyrophosphorylase (carboxylating)
MQLVDFIRLSLAEDIGDGDHSSLACIPAEAQSRARLLVKDTGVLAGLTVGTAVLRAVDPTLKIQTLLTDGTPIKPGDIAFTVSGNACSILTGERLCLNIMQRISGVATNTAKIVDTLQGTNCILLDTRKTTPLNRFLEKAAVRIGGGQNHRFGLYDLIMIKDNHIDFAGGIAQAVHRAKDYLKAQGKNLKIEVEARNLEEVAEILACGPVDRIMLDNFSFPDLRTAVALIGKQTETEASGGITSENAINYALCGVNYISMGALTHTIKNFDLSLKAY